MKTALITASAAIIVASGATAQSHNPAVKDPTVETATHAAKGHNSFTEDQARGRIEKAGYTNVGKLVQNENGLWQGMAEKDGKPVRVALDYKGNVTVH
ncbi:hypothetical protein EDF56_11347 [Novosphingobium sp. PhB165]|uniref:hypothetical protein n=1 Tax=Novosphingobium sp. PhB165 TaxID=2485105 RepID=UPI00104ABE9C|nr:hypothetical protein [Novosphingobium sp. PhB165]TCM14402.1 hypothetical protein EDF56_11347 [Novosphingobium sp. PhB165]